MELDASIEPTIGPYEVYEDEWFNFKAAFEAFITIRDDAESKKLQSFSAHTAGTRERPSHRSQVSQPKLGALAPIRVVNVVFSAGEWQPRGADGSVQPAQRRNGCVKEKGTKRVMLNKTCRTRNSNRVLVPISKVALAAADQKNVAFDAFFTHILMHELMHGLGPHNISVGGRSTTVRQEMKELYSAIEEAKATSQDSGHCGSWRSKAHRSIDCKDDVHHLPRLGVSARFDSGSTKRTGAAIAVQLNYLLDAGRIPGAARRRICGGRMPRLRTL
jgi:hypothetical protein